MTRWTHPWFSFLFGEPHVTRGSLCRTTDTGRFVFVFVFFLAAHILSIRRWRRLSKRPLLLLWPTTAGGLESRDCHVPWQCCRHCLFRMQHSSVAKVMLIFFPSQDFSAPLFCCSYMCQWNQTSTFKKENQWQQPIQFAYVIHEYYGDDQWYFMRRKLWMGVWIDRRGHKEGRREGVSEWEGLREEVNIVQWF